MTSLIIIKNKNKKNKKIKTIILSRNTLKTTKYSLPNLLKCYF